MTGSNALFALRRDRNPVLYLGVPMQIAIVNYLAFLQNPRAGRGRGYCLFRLTHEKAYSVIGREKAERRRLRARLGRAVLIFQLYPRYFWSCISTPPPVTLTATPLWVEEMRTITPA